MLSDVKHQYHFQALSPERFCAAMPPTEKTRAYWPCKVCIQECKSNDEKSTQRDTNTVLRFGHRLPAHCKHANTHTGPITIHCAAAG